MNLVPCNTDSHHDIRHSMGLREHVFDLLTRFNIPVRDIVRLHLFFIVRLQPLTLTDILHDSEGIDRFQLFFHQICHDIISTCDGFT